LKKTTKDPSAASKKNDVATISKRKLDAETKSPVAKAGVSIKAKRHYATPTGTVFLDLTKPAATPTAFAISKGRENLGGEHPMNALFQAVEKARDMPVNDGVNDTLNVYNNDDDDDMNAPDEFEDRYASNVFVDAYLPNVFQHSASDEGSSSSIYEDAEERLSDIPKSDTRQSTPKVTGRPIVKLGSGLAMESATACNIARRRDAKEAPSKRSSIYEASDDDSVVFVKTKTPKNKAPKKKDPATISQKPLDYLRSTLGFPGAAAPQPSLAAGHWKQMYGVENPFGIQQDFNRNQATLPLANAGGLKNPGLLLANAGLVNVGDLRNSGLPSANAAGSRNPELRLPLYGPLAHVSSVEQGRIASQSQTASDIHLAAQNRLAAQMQQMATTQNQLGAQNQIFLARAQMQQAASSRQQYLFHGQAPGQNTGLTATAQGANRLHTRPSFPPGVFASHAGSPADFRGHS